MRRPSRHTAHVERQRRGMLRPYESRDPALRTVAGSSASDIWIYGRSFAPMPALCHARSRHPKREAGMTTITATRPSAKIIKEQIIPPKEYLGMELRKGERLRIIDVEGKQVPDMVCFNLKDP